MDPVPWAHPNPTLKNRGPSAPLPALLGWSHQKSLHQTYGNSPRRLPGPRSPWLRPGTQAWHRAEDEMCFLEKGQVEDFLLGSHGALPIRRDSFSKNNRRTGAGHNSKYHTEPAWHRGLLIPLYRKPKIARTKRVVVNLILSQSSLEVHKAWIVWNCFDDFLTFLYMFHHFQTS